MQVDRAPGHEPVVERDRPPVETQRQHREAALVGESAGAPRAGSAAPRAGRRSSRRAAPASACGAARRRRAGLAAPPRRSSRATSRECRARPAGARGGDPGCGGSSSCGACRPRPSRRACRSRATRRARTTRHARAGGRGQHAVGRAGRTRPAPACSSPAARRAACGPSRAARPERARCRRAPIRARPRTPRRASARRCRIANGAKPTSSPARSATSDVRLAREGRLGEPGAHPGREQIRARARHGLDQRVPARVQLSERRHCRSAREPSAAVAVSGAIASQPSGVLDHNGTRWTPSRNSPCHRVAGLGAPTSSRRDARLLVIVTLAEAGGAQTFAAALAAGLRDRYDVEVAAHGPGALADACASLGCAVPPRAPPRA